MKFTAVGDAIIQRRIPPNFVGFEELTPFIMQGDARSLGQKSSNTSW